MYTEFYKGCFKIVFKCDLKLFNNFRNNCFAITLNFIRTSSMP